MENNVKNRAKYVVAGSLMLLFLGAIYAWSFFAGHIGEQFPTWGKKLLTLNFTITMILFAAGGFLGGKMLKTIRHRYLAMFAGVMMFIGFLALSFMPKDNTGLALALLYIFYGGFTGFGVGVGYTTVLSGVNSWFPDKDGFISGILLACFGLGSLILGIIADKLIPSLGLFPVFRILGIASLVVLVAGSFVLRAPGENDVLPPARKKAVVEGGKDYTTGEMMRRPSYWIYFLWNLCASATGMLVISQASSIMKALGAAAVIGLLVSAFSSVGRLGVGASVDKFGWKATMLLSSSIIIVAGILMVIGNNVNAFPVVLIGMLLAGVCYGGGITIQASLVRTFYGSKNYPMNFSACNLVIIPAAFGPFISGALVDAAGGAAAGAAAYASSFMLVIVMGVVSLLLNLLIRKP